MQAFIARWSSLVARRAHNPKVAGSNPALATIFLSVKKRINSESDSYPAVAGRRLLRSKRIQTLPTLPFFYRSEKNKWRRSSVG